MRQKIYRYAVDVRARVLLGTRVMRAMKPTKPNVPQQESGPLDQRRSRTPRYATLDQTRRTVAEIILTFL